VPKTARHVQTSRPCPDSTKKRTPKREVTNTAPRLADGFQPTSSLDPAHIQELISRKQRLTIDQIAALWGLTRQRIEALERTATVRFCQRLMGDLVDDVESLAPNLAVDEDQMLRAFNYKTAHTLQQEHEATHPLSTADERVIPRLCGRAEKLLRDDPMDAIRKLYTRSTRRRRR
jgi:hypothetical protein